MTERDKELIEKLNVKLDELINEFNGKVTHNNRGAFIGKWKQILKDHNVKGGHWLDALLKRRGL